MPFAATGPQSFIESMRLSGNDDLLGRAVQAAGCPYRRASASAPPGWAGSASGAHPQLPLVSSTSRMGSASQLTAGPR